MKSGREKGNWQSKDYKDKEGGGLVLEGEGAKWKE